ncbi:Adenylate cyclase 1 [Rubripirellula lacrimiformis]|uniref:Adenylate cyclase 1 n=1 Tax=Rubripirellula lacrimiformis TaxID=1930273 RepID=A0A517NDQ5_9BACT|nr:adenylate/guanylate cyclase domain-containing protein [Rubripirellula lacrimiformis]QDT05259.1 Adenylate cyclase 1 [Rubripirellula lacrimiformis]
MGQKVEVTVFDGAQQTWNGVSRTPLEIGRQMEGDPGPRDLQDLGDRQRLVIAPVSARAVPRIAVRIDVLDSGELQVTNAHSRMSFFVGGQTQPLAPGKSFQSADEIIVQLPENRMLRLNQSDPESIVSPTSSGDGEMFRTLSGQVESTMENVAPVRLKELFDGGSRQDHGRVAVDLVRAALTVVQKAAGSNEFFDSAVSAVATMVELDRALVLLREGDEWTVRSSYSAGQEMATHETDGGDGSSAPMNFSRGLTDRVLATGKTVIYDPANYMHTADSSMMVLDRAVAAPILNEKREVIGAIYGDRRYGSGAGDTPIGDLEAALLEVMAGAVSSGIARQRQEAIRSSLTQFFSHAIAERLEKNDDLLAGRDAEVTVLFCDIRGFSTVSERVGPKKTIEWINDVLTELSQCVTNTDGVLVDYVGDELMAMWGAPAEMPDHAARACRSAVEMLKLIEPLRERWKEITPDKFGFGIGINTGVARVGNTGSKVKFKYGPLGNAVNLASRVEGITKKLGVAALISDSTAQAIGKAFDHRRLAMVQVVGIKEPVLIHELKGGANEEWRSMSERYESALRAFDSGDLTGAARSLASLVHAHPDDSPSLVLLGRVVDALTRRDEHVDSIWRLKNK